MPRLHEIVQDIYHIIHTLPPALIMSNSLQLHRGQESIMDQIITGLIPFHSPAESRKQGDVIRHYRIFLKNKGYKIVDGALGPFRSSKNVVYSTAEEFQRGHGFYPHLFKDGFFFGYYEVAKLENYVFPDLDEFNFLISKGYSKSDLSDSFLKTHFQNFGWVPRWSKNNEYFDHLKLLEQEGYKYSGSPEFSEI